MMRLLCGDWGSPRAFLFGPPNQMEKNTRYDIYRLCNLYEKYMCEMCFHHRIIIMRTLVFLSCSFSSSSSSSSSSPVAPRFFGRSALLRCFRASPLLRRRLLPIAHALSSLARSRASRFRRSWAPTYASDEGGLAFFLPHQVASPGGTKRTMLNYEEMKKAREEILGKKDS